MLKQVAWTGLGHAMFAFNWAMTAPMVAVSEWLPHREGNPGFDQGRAELRELEARLRGAPSPLSRPVVVLGGYKAWPVMAGRLRDRLCGLTSGDRSDFVTRSYMNRGDIDKAVDDALRAVRARLGERDGWTPPVDVVAISMGGLVARRAAMDRGERGAGLPRLRVERLFTLASPHGGAKLAERLAPDRATKAMRPDSPFLRELDLVWEREPIEAYPYAVLNDTWVGATRTAPPGCEPRWTRGTVAISHFTVSANRRIVLDIALRLRGEPGLCASGSTPPCD